MPQLSIYVPAELAARLRKEARLKRKSLSAYVAALISERVHQDRWGKEFFTSVVGGWKGDLPATPRGLPEERDQL